MLASDSMPLRPLMFCDCCLMPNPSGTIGRELVLVSARCPQGNKSGLDIKLRILYPGHLKSFPNLVHTEICTQ